MVTTMSSFEDNIVAKGVGGASFSAITAITSEQLWTRPTYCIVTSASVNGNLSSDTLLKWFGNILLLIISDENNIVLIPRFNRFLV